LIFCRCGIVNMRTPHPTAQTLHSNRQLKGAIKQRQAIAAYPLSRLHARAGPRRRAAGQSDPGAAAAAPAKLPAQLGDRPQPPASAKTS
jgi:hypothetical protein